jgi:hypothetical protein
LQVQLDPEHWVAVSEPTAFCNFAPSGKEIFMLIGALKSALPSLLAVNS